MRHYFRAVSFAIVFLICFFPILTTAQANLLWANIIGGTGDDVAIASATDNAGNFYTVGYFCNTLDLDPGPGVNMVIAAGGRDFFVTKYNPYGATLWTDVFSGPTYYENPSDIYVDQNNVVYVIGFCAYGVDFDPGPGVDSISASSDGSNFLCELSSSGALISVKNISVASTSVEKIRTDSTGNIYISGTYSNTTDFDPGPGSWVLTHAGPYWSDAYVEKLDPAANFLWAGGFGNSLIDEIRDIAVSKEGNIYIAGAFADTIDIDFSAGIFPLYAKGNYDILLARYNTNGILSWAKNIGYVGSVPEAEALTLDSQQNVIFTGSAFSAVDFDPGPGASTLGGSGAFVAKFDSLGNFFWAKPFSGSGQPTGWLVDTDPSGNIFCSGRFASTLDFDPSGYYYFVSPATTSHYSAFFAKLDPAGTLEWANKIGSTTELFCFGMRQDGNGGLYAFGVFYGTGEFDPGPPTFSATSNGSSDIFALRFSGGGTSVTENKKKLDVKIFPTPFHNSATIQISDLVGEAELLLFDRTGRMIRKSTIKTGSSEIKRNDLDAGLYLYEIIQDSQMIAKGKLIVE